MDADVQSDLHENEVTWDAVQRLTDTLFVPESLICEDRPSEEADFSACKPSLEAGFITLATQITLMLPSKTLPSKHLVASLLLLCGEHSVKNNWTTELTLKSSEEILAVLCKICSCENVKILISSETHFKLCLTTLCSKLTSKSWRRYPAAVQSFRWILPHVEMPLLGEHLNLVFPPTLLILDDFEPENKIVGCKMMLHVISNVTRSELKRQQFDDVLYDALHKLLYVRETELVVPSVSCLSALLIKTDVLHVQNLEFTRVDRSIGVLLKQMEMEQGLLLRRAYAEALPILLKVGRLSLLRWSDRFFRVFSEYLDVEDGSQGMSQLHTLQAFLWFLHQTWPRASSLARQSLLCLLKILRELTQPESCLIVPLETKTELLSLIEQCLTHFANTAPDKYKQLLEGTESLPFGPTFHDILNRIVPSKAGGAAA